MEQILPLELISDINDLTLPKCIFKFKNGDSILLDNFTKEEKENIFKIKNLNLKNDGTIGYEPLDFSINPTLIGRLLKAKYKIIIKSNNAHSPAHLQQIQETLNNALKILLGQELWYSIFKYFDNNIYNSHVYSTKNLTSYRNIHSLNDVTINRLSDLLSHIIELGETNNIINNLYFFNDVALRAPNKDIAGAFYITLLECIFTPTRPVEIGYSLSMRMAKKNGMNIDYQKRIKKIYGYRSDVFHGKSNVFNIDDLIFIESEATSVLENYIKNSKDFSEENIDVMLLSSDKLR